jgi:outer membrane biosynthesis protein TonB
MLTDTLPWFAQTDIDSPWRRLHWTLPLALLICAVAFIWFAYSMGQPVSHTPEPLPVDAELVELPASALPSSLQKAPAPKQAQTTPPIQQEQPSLSPAPAAPPVAPVAASPATTNNTAVPDRNRSAQPSVQPLPVIPDDLRQDAMNEVATARFHIAEDGSVTVELVKPTQNPRLNRLLLESLKSWKFIPAIIDGKPVVSVEVIVVRVQVK